MSAVVGVPESRPLVESKLAHEGRFWMEKTSALPSGSLALGVKLYAAPAFTDVAGLPPIVGGPPTEGCETVMVKAGSEAVCVPSLTLIRLG